MDESKVYEVEVRESDGWIVVKHVADNQAVWEGLPTLEAAQACANRLNAGDHSVVLYGPMFCESHRQTLWPHDDCAGPGVWLPTVELNERDIYPIPPGTPAAHGEKVA